MTNSRAKQQKSTQGKFSESIPSQALQAFLAQRKLRFRDTARPVKMGWIGHPWKTCVNFLEWGISKGSYRNQLD